MTEPTWREVSDLIAATPGSIESQIPERIRYLRENHRAPDGTLAPLSHTDLARLLADKGWVTDRTTLWKIENPSAGNGRRKVSIDEIVALARALGVTVAELLLPEGGLAQIEARSAAVSAADALAELGAAWSRYATAVAVAQQALSQASDSSTLRAQFRAWADELRASYTRHTVQLWRKHQAQLIERREPIDDRDLLMKGTEEEVARSESYRRFLQRLSMSDRPPLFHAYDDILNGAPLALDGVYPGRARTQDPRG